MEDKINVTSADSERAFDALEKLISGLQKDHGNKMDVSDNLDKNDEEIKVR